LLLLIIGNYVEIHGPALIICNIYVFPAYLFCFLLPNHQAKSNEILDLFLPVFCDYYLYLPRAIMFADPDTVNGTNSSIMAEMGGSSVSE
jgi:hypothetical protein